MPASSRLVRPPAAKSFPRRHSRPKFISRVQITSPVVDQIVILADFRPRSSPPDNDLVMLRIPRSPVEKTGLLSTSPLNHATASAVPAADLPSARQGAARPRASLLIKLARDSAVRRSRHLFDLGECVRAWASSPFSLPQPPSWRRAVSFQPSIPASPPGIGFAATPLSTEKHAITRMGVMADR